MEWSEMAVVVVVVVMEVAGLGLYAWCCIHVCIPLVLQWSVLAPIQSV